MQAETDNTLREEKKIKNIYIFSTGNALVSCQI